MRKREGSERAPPFRVVEGLLGITGGATFWLGREKFIARNRKGGGACGCRCRHAGRCEGRGLGIPSGCLMRCQWNGEGRRGPEGNGQDLKQSFWVVASYLLLDPSIELTISKIVSVLSGSPFRPVQGPALTLPHPGAVCVS